MARVDAEGRKRGRAAAVDGRPGDGEVANPHCRVEGGQGAHEGGRRARVQAVGVGHHVPPGQGRFLGPVVAGDGGCVHGGVVAELDELAGQGPARFAVHGVQAGPGGGRDDGGHQALHQRGGGEAHAGR